MGRAVAEFRLLSPRCQNQKRILGGGQWRNFDLPPRPKSEAYSRGGQWRNFDFCPPPLPKSEASFGSGRISIFTPTPPRQNTACGACGRCAGIRRTEQSDLIVIKCARDICTATPVLVAVSTRLRAKVRPPFLVKKSSHHCRYRWQLTFNEYASPIIPEYRSWSIICKFYTVLWE